MPYLFNPLSENSVFHNTKIKIYPDGCTNITYCKKPIFREKAAENRPKDDVLDECKLKEGREEQRKVERDRSSEIIRLNRDRVRDIVLMNDFKYFLTITINPDQLDSFDVQAVKKKLHTWLNNMQKRKGLQYVLIPEYHKSGRVHCHALVNDVLRLVDSGKRDKDKTIYNCPDWRYGFTTAIPLDDNKMRVANYVTKYITKGSEKIFGKYFWSSKNIKREPETVLSDTDYSMVGGEEFKPLLGNDEIAFKYECSLMFDNGGKTWTEGLHRTATTENKEPVPIVLINSAGLATEVQNADECVRLLQSDTQTKPIK